MNKLIAILGPTASGKSALAMKVAQKFEGEIICADSRTIYKGLDTGTAKPTAEDQRLVPHHLIDVVESDQSYSAAEFKDAAEVAIADIFSRHSLPIMVGGSGLYAYSVLYDYQFPAGANNGLRKELEGRPLDQLVEQLQQLDPEAAATIDLKNPRRVIRGIETAGQPKTRSQLRPGSILVALRPSEEELEGRIAKRTNQMIECGLEAETRATIERYGLSLEVLSSPGYAEIVDYIGGKISAAKVAELINLHTRQLAKRQLTWLRRNQDIQWFDNAAQAYDYIAEQLQL